jgi:(1->4)-alpha-D-glucan 1-alpha-D-glucosylmutase
LIKLTAPGIPDFYQGTELWELSLVDPDNRRPVDYDLRRRLLADLEGLSPEQIWRRMDDGLPKLWVIQQTLRLRRKGFFAPGDDYRPLFASGERSAHLIAFARGERAITVVPRLVLKVAGEWKDTSIEMPRGAWRNALSGEKVEGGEVTIRDLLRRFPVALLVRER